MSSHSSEYSFTFARGAISDRRLVISVNEKTSRSPNTANKAS
ncbi:hypothetical protein [Pseudanabaena mucicola]|nr:hypothetical protein [Pseudanabaena mucicola]